MKSGATALVMGMLLFGSLSCGAGDSQLPQVDLTRPRVDPVPGGDPNMVRLFVVGDSTVKNHNAAADGWGDYIAASFDSGRIEILNWALGGRSSRSFIETGRWDKVLEQMRPGDFVMAQFGHNDQKPVTSNRGTILGAGDETQEVISEDDQQPKTVHTYGWYLRRYARDAKAAGATLIFVSPVPRNRWTKAGAFRNVMRDHAECMRQVAAEEGVRFLDVNAILAAHYDELGKAEVTALYFNAGDGTHTGLLGAQRSAEAVIQGLRAMTGCELVKYLDNGTHMDRRPAQ